MRANAAGLAAMVLTLAMGNAAAAPLPAPPPEIAAERLSSDVYPSHRVQLRGGVIGIPDVTYVTHPGYRPLKLDLYLPPSTGAAQGPHGVVVYAHGGGWRGGTTRFNGAFRNWPDVLASLSSKGYVVAAVSYRLSGEAPFPAAVQDVKAAIRWLRANAGEYNIDKDRFVVWGPSAGGHIVGLVAVSCGVASLSPPTSAGAAPESDCVQAGVGWFGAYDFELLNAEPRTDGALAAERAFLGCDGPCSRDVFRAASGVTYADRTDPPILLIHGGGDRTVPASQSVAFDARLRAAGVKSDLVIIPEVDHNFMGRSPEQTRQANIEAVQLTFDFIDKTIGASVAGR